MGLHHEIGHIVVELTTISYISVRIVGAVPAQVGNVDRNASLRQRRGHAVHVYAAPRRAMNKDLDLGVSAFLEAIRECSAISRLTTCDRGKAREVHSRKRFGYRFEGLRLGDMTEAS